jgi:hypothetical protein
VSNAERDSLPIEPFISCHLAMIWRLL